MNRFQIIFSTSPWFILVCLLVGALYAAALYQKKPVWGKPLNWALAACRFLVVSVLCFLLLGPFIRQISNAYEKPTIVLAVDNSQSVALTNDSTQLNTILNRVQALRQTLQDKDIQVDVQLLNKPDDNRALNAQDFTENTTNLSQLLNTVQSNYENRNLAGVVLVSDGIYNQGVSPEYAPYNFPIYAVALGDTVPKQDVNLKAVHYNQITYVGNRFPIVAELHSTGFSGKIANVVLRQNGKVLERKSVPLRGDGDVQEVTFYQEAKGKGMQHFTVEAELQTGEFTAQNNLRDAYVDVIDGKEKILLLALSPHPDIKAIKSILEKNENYSLDIVTVGNGTPKESKYDLVILHQIPDNSNSGLALAKKFLDQGTPAWYILGGQTSLNQFNASNNVLRVNSRSNQQDQVTPAFNSSFSLFTYAAEMASLLAKMPPVSVPFGEFNVPAGSDVLLFQRVGSVVTNKPLLAVHTSRERKSAVMLGDGLWEWRLEEYNLTEKHEAVDELVSKLVQYLSAKEDKRKLRVYPIADEFYDYEQVVLEAETYNDIYERIYDQKINLELTDDSNKVSKYSFTNAENNSRFAVSGLRKGVYRYKATAAVQGKTEQVAGEFTVKELQLEALTTTANHNLLRTIARQTGGQVYFPSQIDNLTAQLTSNPPPDVIQSSEELREFINLKWLFFVLLALLTIEWSVRKYQGAY